MWHLQRQGTTEPAEPTWPGPSFDSEVTEEAGWQDIEWLLCGGGALACPEGSSVWRKATLIKNYLFIHFGCTGSQLQHSGASIFVVAHGIFSWGIRTLNCGTWDLVPWPGIEPGLLALGAWNLSHWTTREVPWRLIGGKHIYGFEVVSSPAPFLSDPWLGQWLLCLSFPR